MKSSKSYILDTNVALAYIAENASSRDRVVEILMQLREVR